MSVGYILGGFFLYIAPPLISIVSRKIRNKPNLKNPTWQYVVTFIIMTILIFSGTHSYASQMLLPALLVYGICFAKDYSAYRQNRTIAVELASLDFDNSEEIMQFTKSYPHLIDEIGKLIDIHKKLKH